MTRKLNAQELRALMIRDTLLRRGDIDDALQPDLSISHIPVSNDKLVACGDAAAKKGRLDDAKEAYKKANALDKLLSLGEICATGDAGPENYERHQLARECFAYCCYATDQNLALGTRYLAYLKTLNPATLCSTYFGLTYSLLSSAKAHTELEDFGDICRNFGQFEMAIGCYTNAKANAKLDKMGNELLAMQTDDGDTNPTQYALNCFKASGNKEKVLKCAAWFVRLGRHSSTANRIHVGLDAYRELGVTLPEEIVTEVLDALLDTGNRGATERVAGMFAEVRIEEQNRKPAKKARPRRSQTKKN